MENIQKWSNSLLILLGIAVILVIILIPLPAIVVDILIALNLIQAMLIFLSTLSLCGKKAADFSFLPTFLLVSTLFGLLISISAARLILVKGAALEGWVIRALSSLVTGSNEIVELVVGFGSFTAFTAITVVLIVRKNTLISEVAARFVLDSLPGKQMHIDALYSSGEIDQEEAAIRKEALQRESDFYGAMDGTSKFLSGNVKAVLLIIVVIIAGGIAIDVFIRGEAMSYALRTYIFLSIGYGIVFFLPALLLSTAAKIAVKRLWKNENGQLYE